MSKKIAIIGGGNLGVAMAEGLISSGFVLPEHLIVTRRNISALKSLEEKGVMISNDNVEAVRYADWIVLAIKPFQVKEVLAQIKPHLDEKKHSLISVVTGVWIKDMQEMVGKDFALFRAMPNTAIAIQESMTCICSHGANQDQLSFVADFFDQLGKSVFIEEKLMDAATVLGACGTAYAMRYIRANIQGGIEIGFSAATASLIAAQTVKGAAELLLQKNTHPEQEIDKVTTPKGCTIAGLNEMEHQGFSSSLIKGIVTSYKKIVNDM
ncbi:MAG: pyrroline-5-carboxylate reductase [Chitinophagaceae bacterium]|nr:pyrroline-5-carboxylate reductase [Chitinophagaceae bacterium]MCA6457099.1 pyrroline-5-carboxylate reductase [Chitinophagaceae bacterium]MCA6460591.1 pyrroline-5-carboxylate reductase [Chitinophagaceae bacterium]MCA6466101.1 pyrroline-5-carboxylate reductase [Chitinophagaceae bacterium]MEA3425408.1 pyrroline-5-carboxylate reductase [Bacteroidota bacterium]